MEKNINAQYLEEHNVESALSDAVTHVLTERPADPIQAIGRFLSQMCVSGSKREFTISTLKERPELAPQCAELCFTEFEEAYKDLGIPSVEAALANLRKDYMNDDCVPLVLVATDAAGKLLGTVTLDEEDMTTRPNLTPWVADVLTLPEARGMGVASALLVRLTEVAKSVGVSRLYLWSAEQEAFFAKRGFTRLEPERFEYAGEMVTLMYKDTGPAAE